MSSRLILLLWNKPAHHLLSSQWTGVKKSFPPCRKAVLLAGGRVLSAMTYMPLSEVLLRVHLFLNPDLGQCMRLLVPGDMWLLNLVECLLAPLPLHWDPLLTAALLSTYWGLLLAWWHWQLKFIYIVDRIIHAVISEEIGVFKTAANCVRCNSCFLCDEASWNSKPYSCQARFSL